MPPVLRKTFFQFHLWTGLVLGLALVVVAISGAVLVFRPSLERRMDARRFIVPVGTVRLSPDALVARAKAAHSESEFESVRFYGDPTAPFLAYFADKNYVHLNRYTGEVLGTRARYGEGFGWIEGLHKYLRLETKTGESVNGTMALVCCAMVLAGVVLWWPATRRALKAGLTLNRKLTGRPWNLNLHKALGIYTAVILLVSAFTGAPIALDWLKAGLYPLTASTKTPLPIAPADSSETDRVGFEPLARQIDALLPEARETYIALPKNGVISSYVIAADAPHPNARTYVWFDGATGLPLRAQPYATAPRGFRFYYWMMSLHTGMVGGWTVRLIMLFAALAVPVLVYTGAASFLRRKFRHAVARPVAPLAIRSATHAEQPAASLR